jgi:hypothetical protein
MMTPPAQMASTNSEMGSLQSMNNSEDVAYKCANFNLDRNSVLLPFNNSSEDLSNGANVSLSRTTSYFSTVTTESATLAAGVNGQIKTFAMYADNGPMVIIVTNYGWNNGVSVGAITFNNVGDACTLQYINGRWFCIGNNGAVFS